VDAAGLDLVVEEVGVELLFVGLVLQLLVEDLVGARLLLGELLELLLGERGRDLVDALVLVLVGVDLLGAHAALAQHDRELLVVVLLKRVHEAAVGGVPDLDLLVVGRGDHQVLLALK
jgi:hypothetical protein